MSGEAKRLSERKTALLLGGVCWLVYFSTYLGRYNFSAGMSEMAGTGAWGKAQLGGIAAAFYLSYGLGQFPSGLLGDRFSQKRLVLLGLLGAAVTNSLFPFAANAKTMQIIWFLNGAAQALVWPPMARLIADRTSAKQCVSIVLWLSSTGPAGMLCSYLLSAVMLEAGGWKYSFWAAGIWIALMAALWMAAVEFLDKRGSGKQENAAEAEFADASDEAGRRSAWLTPVMFGFLAATFLHGLLKDGLVTWIPTCLTEVFSISPSFSVLLTTALPVVNLAGVYVANRGNRRLFQNEAGTAAALFGITAASIACMLTVSAHSLGGTVLLFAGVTSAMTGVNTLFISLLPMHYQKQGAVATVSGLLNAVTYVGSAVSSVLFGYLTERRGWKGTQIFWCALAAVGVLCCLAVMRRWKSMRQDIYKD